MDEVDIYRASIYAWDCPECGEYNEVDALQAIEGAVVWCSQCNNEFRICKTYD